MEQFAGEHHSPESLEDQHRIGPAEKTPPLPLIKAEENRHIEAIGGEYRGFVDQTDGKRQFEDLLVNHCAHYDQNLRQVVETVISTEAVNDEGGAELDSPEAVDGFSILIVRQSPAGELLESPQTISIRRENFADNSNELRDLRFIAHAAHRFILQNAGQFEAKELKRQTETYLTQQSSWNKKAA